MFRRLSIFFIVLLSSTWALAAEKTAALDCSCEKITWQQSFDKAQHVVFGEIKNVQRHGDELATADFIPLEVFKGEENHITKLAGSSKAGVSCRRVLHEGFYIAYGGESHSVVLNNCASSRQLREEEDLVSVLTELKSYAESKNPAYVAQPSATNQLKQSHVKNNINEKSNSRWLIILLLAVVAVSAIIIFKKVLPRLNK